MIFFSKNNEGMQVDATAETKSVEFERTATIAKVTKTWQKSDEAYNSEGLNRDQKLEATDTKMLQSNVDLQNENLRYLQVLFYHDVMSSFAMLIVNINVCCALARGATCPRNASAGPQSCRP